tara:strand:+ start:1307 stop:11071 length:9765 start_codon:yes stop_codon:yes gene_type:complete
MREGIKMENENEETIAVSFGRFGDVGRLLIAPFAILIALFGGMLFGVNIDLNDFVVPLVVLGCASMMATAPIFGEKFIGDKLSSNLIVGLYLILAIVVSSIVANIFGGVVGFLFTLTSIIGYIFVRLNKNEEFVILTFFSIGFYASLGVAGAVESMLPEIDYTATYTNELNELRGVTAEMFFTFLFIMTSLGIIFAILQRNILQSPGSGSWFKYLPNVEEGYKPVGPLLVALSMWSFAHILTLIHFALLGGISDEVVQDLGMTGEQIRMSGQYLSVWWALFTGIIAIITAFFYSERWFTRSMLISATWILYSFGRFQEQGYFEQFISPNEDGARWIDLLSEGIGMWLWLGITFFTFVLVFYFSTHEKYGNKMNRTIGDIGNARAFWNENWASVLIAGAFAFGLTIRVVWNVLPAMNAIGTGGWDLTGGSDPWYMKRAIDYIIAERAHFIFDADRAYPIGDINPRPPLFTWSLALGGLILAPILGISAENAVWWSIGALPAIYGALIIFPVAGMAREVFGKGAGVLAAWLIAFMPGHVSHTTFALADHDAFVLLFATVGFYYYIMSMKNINEDKILIKSGWNPTNLLLGFSKVWENQRLATSYSILSGVSFAIVALAWKGFIYAPSIIFVFFMIQILFNLFRRRDSMAITVLTVTMLLALWLTSLPFYMHPELGLLLNGEFQAMFYISGLILVSGYIVCSARDKPWLLVIGTGTVLVVIPLFLVWLQWLLGYSDAGSTLFTGGGYFSKNKIFGTIAEAQAPSRGLLFGSFGAIIFVSALARGFGLSWSGLRHRKVPELLLAVWVLLASYMAWSAGRFVYNATPVMAIVSAGAFSWLWANSGWDGLVKQWRRMGINTPGARFTSGRKVLFKSPGFIAIFMIFIMVFSQHATYGLDAAIPRGSDKASDVDEELYNLMPDFLRWSNIIDGTAYEDVQGYWFLNSFGPGFNDYYWNAAYDWLSEQDKIHTGVNDEVSCNELEGNWNSETKTCGMKFSDKPAFVSWWDYGFQAMSQGDHPTVADNFQTGIPTAGNMLLARNQDDVVAMFITRLGIGDVVWSGGNHYSNSFKSIIESNLETPQYEEFYLVTRGLTQEIAKERMFEVYEWTEATTNQGVLALSRGYVVEDGVKTDNYVYRIYEGEKQLGNDYLTEAEAKSAFEDRVANRDVITEYFDEDSGQTFGASHYVVGDYWYTSDIIEKFDDAGTSIHRQNSQIALATQVLTGSLDSEQINDLYNEIIQLDIYEVPDSEGAPGQTITRNHEISYFAIDTRLYPLGGGAYLDTSFNRKNPTGIFYAPTILSGQDPAHFMNTIYETQRGTESIIERTAEDFNEQYKMDVLRSQSGGDVEIIELVDVRYDHSESFFDTMLARTYVGYGASDLGLTDYTGTVSATPKTMLSSASSGTPGSALESAWPLPGAMMNHFVIANWYDERGDFENFGLGEANFGVKVMKYYAGAELCGSVTVPELDTPIAGATLLIERDGFSGEGTEDLDNRTYWIPIGTTTTDSGGNYCFTAPAGRIRVTALTGEFDSSADLITIQSGELDVYSMNLDIIGQNTGERVVNPITGLLSEVSGMMWLGENEINITSEQAERKPNAEVSKLDIELETSSASGVVNWEGEGQFSGLPLVETEFVLQNVWNEEISYNVSTINKTVSGEDLVIEGEGIAVYTETDGVVQSLNNENLRVSNFIGNYSRYLSTGQSYTGNGTWSGKGILEASWLEDTNISECINSTVPNGSEVCLGVDGKYLINGTLVASGRFTADELTELTTFLDNATFEASGKFVGTGVFEGTAQYSGVGDYSGDMVVPGTFYANDIAPGEYKMYAIFNNGRTSDVIEEITVGLEHTGDLELSLTGLQVSGLIFDESGDAVNATVEIIDLDLDTQTCTEVNLNNDGIWVDSTQSLFSPAINCLKFSSGEEGNVSIGPLSPGNYSLRVDLDGDLQYELNSTLNEQNNQLTFIGEILEHGDVEFSISPVVINESNINQPDIIDVSNTLVTFTSVDDGTVVNISSDENGVINAELPLGDWIMKSKSGNDLLLWQEFNLNSENLNLEDIKFSRSILVQGSLETQVRDDNNQLVLQPLNGISVKFRSGSIQVIVESDNNGEFDLELPSGMEFDVTTETPDGMVSATNVNISKDMDNVNLIIFAKQSVSWYHSGKVLLNPNNVTYDNSIPDFENFEVYATYLDSGGDEFLDSFIGVTWVSEVDDSGRFEFLLPLGNYSLMASEEILQVSETIYTSNSTVGDSLDWNLEANPLPVNVEIRTFIDDNGDQSFDNGTPVNIDFRIVPTDSSQDQINITSELFDEDGILNVDLPFGEYFIEMDTQNIDNGSEFDTLFVSTPAPIKIGISGIDEPIDLGLVPTWKLDVELVDQKFEPLDNVSVIFESLDENSISTDVILYADENGTILEYVRSGNYSVTTRLIDVEGTSQIFNAKISIDENPDNRTFVWRTLEVANLNLTLIDTNLAENNSLPPLSLIAVSNDGLHEVNLPFNNESGFVSAQLYPGNWNLELNHTDSKDGLRWVLENFELGELSANETIVTNVELNRFVEVSGTVFWDFNEDGEYQSNEALGNSEVRIESDGFETLNMTTDEENGNWNFYVPASKDYSINVTRTGFNYNNSLFVKVLNTSINSNSEDYSTDISLDADNVTVSGRIDLQYGFESISNQIYSDLMIELIPAADEGYERDSVEIIFEENDEGELIWSAVVEPGKWILHAEATNFHMVVYDSFEAEIIDGAEYNTTLKAGGYVPISTRWTDFSGDERNITTLQSTNSTITDIVYLTMSFNDAKWNISLAEEIETYLVPAGTLQISGEFTVLEMGMEMEYTGDVITGASSPGLADDGTLSTVTSAEAVIEFNRILVHKIDYSVNQIISNDEEHEFNDGDMINAKIKDINGDGITDTYHDILIKLNLEYAGNLAKENYTFTASVAGADSEFWQIDFEISEDEFDTSKNMTFGISESLNSSEIIMKIKLPDGENSISYDTGHNVRVIATSETGESSNYDLKVHIPQEYSIEASAPYQVGITSGGGSSSFDVSVKNLGNGDDNIQFDIDKSDLPSDWTVSQPQPRIIPPNGTSEVGISVIMPENTFEGQYVLHVNVTSESGETEVIDVIVLVSKAKLRMDTPSMGAGGGVVRQPVDFSIVVHNDGLITAEGVTIEGYLVELNISAVSMPVNILPGQNETVTVLFDTNEIVAGDYKFEFTLDAGTTPLDNESNLEVELTKVKFSVQDSAGSGNIVPIIIICIFAIGIYSFVRSRRTGTGPGF